MLKGTEDEKNTRRSDEIPGKTPEGAARHSWDPVPCWHLVVAVKGKVSFPANCASFLSVGWPKLSPAQTETRLPFGGLR